MFSASQGKRRRAAVRRSQLAAASAEILEERALLSAIIPTAVTAAAATTSGTTSSATSTANSNSANATSAIPSLDGSGNNLQNPDWGKAGTNLTRISEADYTDGIASLAGQDRPGAREISNALAAQGDVDIISDRGLAAFIYAFGQFLDHDLDLVTTNRNEPLAIPIPSGDPQFDPDGTGTQTMNTSRSNVDPLTGTGIGNPREQVNAITAWLDGSMIYGSSEATATSLRTLSGGQLKTSEGNLLPVNASGSFLAGDIRANENPELTAIHTLFVREHNRIASELARQNSRLTDEQLYQQARAIVVGELQAITYNEWLPALLGSGALDRYRGYNPNVNPAISNEFAAAGFRLGHSLLGNDIEFLDNNGNEIADEVALQDAFFNPELVRQNGIDSILKYLASDPASELDTKIVDGVRNFLSPAPGLSGFDLATLNIMRGRDHGIADYNTVREAYGLPKVTRFSQITSNLEVQSQLRSLYGSVDNIDLWVGMLAEDHVRGASVGPTVRAIVSEQFERLRDGDRFWYQNRFSGRQLREIENTTLTDLIKRNTELTNVQENAFFFRAGVSGTVFNDTNGDGRLGRNERAIAGRSIELVEADSGEVLATTTTNRNGRYSFDVEDGIRTGKYLVRDAATGITSPASKEFAITRGDEFVTVNLGIGRRTRSTTTAATPQLARTTSQTSAATSSTLAAETAVTAIGTDLDDGAASETSTNSTVNVASSKSTKAAATGGAASTTSTIKNDESASSRIAQAVAESTDAEALDRLFSTDELTKLLTLLG